MSLEKVAGTKDTILTIYALYHKGKDRAITREKFYEEYHKQLSGMTDRDFRQLYSKLPICTCSKGGYFPEDPKELLRFDAFLQKYEVSLKERRQSVLSFHMSRFHVKDSNGQLGLFRGIQEVNDACEGRRS